ncbi:hypothetical protein Glove_194g16 [Diversispora epigaea]|uniref:Uncharacterized protein n=1 Tax=Diversispora epigaea TaxID=1348612 RepID=A0A397IKZ0_9GLOM|nr:hypothetical protein Glove_194g16 [Diversispora epigaea]
MLVSSFAFKYTRQDFREEEHLQERNRHFYNVKGLGSGGHLFLLHDSIYIGRPLHYPDFRKKSQAHTTIFGWFEDQKLPSSSSSTLPKGTTIFKKTRLYSSTVYGPCETVNNHIRESSPEVKPNFSFTENERGAVIEPVVNLAEKAIYGFLVKNESAIPLEVIEKNKLAHGIMINEKGRWSDHALQHVTILACEIVICLASREKKLDVAPGDKENVDPSQKRKLDNIENIDTPQKKRLDDANFGEITDFIIDILGELEETEKGDKKKMLKLAMDENEYMAKFWKMVRAEERRTQLHPYYNKLMTLSVFVSTEFEDEESRRMKIRGMCEQLAV